MTQHASHRIVNSSCDGIEFRPLLNDDRFLAEIGAVEWERVEDRPSDSVPEASKEYGDVYAHALPFAGKTLPLPAGSWRVIATIPLTRPDGVLIDMAALEKVTDDTLAGLVILLGSDAAGSPAAGFHADRDCERSDINYVKVAADIDHGYQSCRLVDYLPGDNLRRPQNNPFLHATYGELLNQKLALPSALVSAVFRLADRRSILAMEVYFNPDLEKVDPAGHEDWLHSDWNKYNIGRFPDKQAFMARMIAWTDKWAPLVTAAWRGKPIAELPQATLAALP